MVVIKLKHPVCKQSEAVEFGRFQNGRHRCAGSVIKKKKFTNLFLAKAHPNKSTRMVKDVDMDNPLMTLMKDRLYWLGKKQKFAEHKHWNTS